ncbi:MAG: DUF2059 domain-containing protein [Rhizomicrobium sp.]
MLQVVKDDPAKVAAAREFITLFHPKTDPHYIATQLDIFMPSMIKAAKRADPKLDAKKFEHDRRALIMKNSGIILDRQATVFSRHFTLQELKDLIAWCRSPLGHKLAVETGKIQQEMLMWNRKTREEARMKDDDDDAAVSPKPGTSKGQPAPTKPQPKK